MLCLACKLTVLLLCIRSTAPAAAAASPVTVVRTPASTCLQDKQQQRQRSRWFATYNHAVACQCIQHPHEAALIDEAALIHETTTLLQVHVRTVQGSTTLWYHCAMLLSLTHLQQLRWHYAVLEALLPRPKH
jgi:hypothetical protein